MHAKKIKTQKKKKETPLKDILKCDEEAYLPQKFCKRFV